jgi:hypothetical protein
VRNENKETKEQEMAIRHEGEKSIRRLPKRLRLQEAQGRMGFRRWVEKRGAGWVVMEGDGFGCKVASEFGTKEDAFICLLIS